MNEASGGIGLIAVVGLLWGGIGVLNSLVGRRGWSIPLYYAITSFFSCIIMCIAVVRWPVLLSGQAERLPELMLVIIPAAIVNILAMMLILIAMRRGHNGLTWTIGQSAMVIPFLASVGIWGNPAGGAKWLGLAFTLAALVMIGTGKGSKGKEDASKEKVGHGWMHIAFLGFVLNGIAQTLNTIPSRWEGWVDTANLRPVLGLLVILPVTLVWAAIRHDRPCLQLVVTSIAASCVGALSSVLLFKGIDLMSRAGLLAVSYPLAVGVCIVSFSIYSAISLKENFDTRDILATILGIAGIAALAA